MQRVDEFMQTETKMSRIPERKLNLLKTSELVLGNYNPNTGSKQFNQINREPQVDHVFNRIRVSNSVHNEKTQLMTIQPPQRTIQNFQTINDQQYNLPPVIPRVRNGQIKEHKEVEQVIQKEDAYQQMMIDPFELREKQIREQINKEKIQIKQEQAQKLQFDQTQFEKTTLENINPDKIKVDNFPTNKIPDKIPMDQIPTQKQNTVKVNEEYVPVFKPKMRSMSTKEQEKQPKKIVGNEEVLAVATGVQELDDSTKIQEELFACSEGCGRSFTQVALEKHIPICKKVFQQKRNQFNVQQKRIIDNEQLKLQRVAKLKDKIENKGKKQSSSKEKSWKEESEKLRSEIKQNKLPPKNK